MAKWLLEFPDRFPQATSGLLLPDGTLVTGHENGYVARWNFDTAQPEILLRASSEVHGLHQGPSGDIFAGCQAGDLHRIMAPNFKSVERILPATNTKYTRVWRVQELSPGELLYTSTYGVVKILRRGGNGWIEDQLGGHTHAVFAVAYAQGLLATGDYNGTINLWRRQKGTIIPAGNLRIPSYVSGLTFPAPGLLSAVGKNGVLYLFERQSDDSWRYAFESDAASGPGKAIAVISNQVVAATEREIIEVDPASQVIRSAKFTGGIAIFPKAEGPLVLTSTGLAQLDWAELDVKSDIIAYEYLKVSLLGNTGYGKTTLASALATGTPGTHQSTYGRRVWTWNYPSHGTPRRVLLNDNGGQEQVIGTLLPLSADSNVALLFFKKTELRGLDTAVELHDRLRPTLNPRARSYLVETYIDHDMTAVTEDRLKRVVKDSGFAGVFKVAANDPTSVDEFRAEFSKQLDWTQARKAVQSNASAALMNLIEEFKAAGKTVLLFRDIKQAFEDKTGDSIFAYHLKFLLQSLTDSGQVEYYPSIGDTVVLDDPEFNRIRSDIPIWAQDQGGLVDWKQVEDRYADHPTYVAMLNRYYTANDIALDIGGGKRLFPAFLEDKNVRIPSRIQPFLKDGINEKVFPTREVQITNLLAALFDLKLEQHHITANEALFGLGSNAYLYYKLSPSQSALEGSRLTVRYAVGGPSPPVVARLASSFEELLHALYGKPLSTGG